MIGWKNILKMPIYLHCFNYRFVTPAWKMPYIAPHLVEQIEKQEKFNPKTYNYSHNDWSFITKTSWKQVDAFIERNKHLGVKNASVILDTRDMGVKALVGSADYYNADIHGR